jgi:hypothetical protein
LVAVVEGVISVEKWKSGRKMAKFIIRVRLKNAPEFTFVSNIDTAGDLPRFLGNASRAVKNALRVYPVIREHAVEKITVAPE